MLLELNITDFAIIDQLTLTFAPGFTVLTGETGAGKSIIIDAMLMLLGGRGDSAFVRAGRDRARLEATFRLSPELRTELGPLLEQEGLEGDDPDYLLLGREIRSTGRSLCRVNGQTVTLSLLEEVARPLIDIHGQNEHLSLMQVRQHQRFLDRYAGLDAQREALAGQVRRLHQVRQELAGLLRDQQSLARRIDQLTFQVEEIQAAGLKPGEEAALTLERTRLANAEQLAQFAGEIYRLLVEGQGDEQQAASDLLGQVTRLADKLARLDETWAEHEEQANSLVYQVEALAGVARDYAEAIEFDPARLGEVEERLNLIFNLKRKYGDSIETIVQFGERARAELENISHSEERADALRIEEESLRRQIGRLALALSSARRQAGQKLAAGVVAELADLGMERADFQVELRWVEEAAGVYVETEERGVATLACDERGIDRIEFLLAPNPGEPPKPLIKVASGGETSRIMLALKSVLAVADETPTLIFDEIDQGIGGRVGGVVGRKLRGLAHQGQHQVLCVTHLPQIAGYGDLHYHVTKQVTGERTQTIVAPLSDDSRVEELAQMLGLLSDSTRASAREILREAKS